MISIIIPIYNPDIEKLKKCIESVINQTYCDLEIILINDGSCDKIKKICDKYSQVDSRIIVCHKKNEGVSIARNYGIKISKGEFLTFLDADDYLETNAIELLYKTATEKRVDVVRGEYFIEHEKNTRKGEINTELYDKISYDRYTVIKKILNGEIKAYVWVLLINSKIVKNKILFNGNIHYMEDTIFYLKIFSDVKNYCFIENRLCYHVINSESATNKLENFSRNMFNAIEVYKILNNIIYDKLNGDNELLKTNLATNSTIVAGYLFLMYRAGMKKEDIKEQYEELRSNKDFNKMLKNVELSRLKTHLKIPLYLIKLNEFKFLYIFWMIRNLFTCIKEKIK